MAQQQPVLIFGDDVMPEGLTYLGQSSFAPPSAPTHLQVLTFEGSVTVVAWCAQPAILKGVIPYTATPYGSRPTAMEQDPGSSAPPAILGPQNPLQRHGYVGRCPRCAELYGHSVSGPGHHPECDRAGAQQ